MKKLFAILLAVALMATLSVSAFADDSPLSGKDEGTYNIGIGGAYQTGAPAEENISVDISWDEMKFTYTANMEYNTGSHKNDVTGGSWSTNKAAITVTNHSNVPMSAGFSFAPTQGIKGVLTETSVIIESANQEKYRTAVEGVYPAPSGKTEFSVDPTSDAISASGSLGTITVSLAKYDGFAYDVTGVDSYDTLKNTLSAAYNNGARKFAINGTPDNVGWIKQALGEFAQDGSIDLTLCDVATVSDNAFDGCTALASVSLPKCTTLGENAFRGCTKLTNVDLPLATTIGYTAFSQCTALTDISLPEVTSLGGKAFSGCSELVSVSLPKCTSIGEYAFICCPSLESITFGTPITTWGNDVFRADFSNNVNPANVTLTFASGQKTFDGDNTNGWTLSGTDLAGGENAEFCGYTFKQIIISAATNP